ncbi:10507_t:CDS:2, partial [Acaulospora morrowiae]
AIRVGLGREQDRELSNRRDDRDRPLHERTGVLPDLYRPSSDHHIRESDRRPIREFERDYRNRDMRVEIPGVDRYRADYPRDNHQGRERLSDNMSDRHSRERRPSWELEREKDYRVPGAFAEKDLADNRRTRENEFENRGNSDEKIESHKQSYLQPERRISRSLEIDQMNRSIKLETVRRVDNERIPLSVNDKHLPEIRVRDEKSTDVQSKESNQDLILPKDEDDLPYPWKKCISSKNKVYYYNTETHASYWNYPSEDNGKKQTIDSRQAIEQSEGGKHTDYESSHKDDNGDVDTPRKKLRLTAEHESIDRIIMPDNRKDSNSERSLGPDEQLTFNNTPSSRDLPLRDLESSVRRTRSNTINNVTTTPPKMQASYSEASQSSPTIRSPASMFGDRRYSADYESRRGPYASPQLQSPSSSLRNPFGRIPPSEFYDHNDMFRHDDFGGVRGPGGIMDMRMAGTMGSNISGVMMPQVNSQLPTNNRSGRFIPNHSFGMDQGPMPGVRRMSSVGRGGLPSTHFPPQYRRRSPFEDERIEEQTSSMIGIETENGHASSHRSNGSLRNPVGIGNKNESDEEAWRTEDEMVDFELADTEPQSLLFRRPVPYNQFSQPLPDNEIIRRQVAPVWNHITSSVAGDELFQQFEHIMNDNSHSRKRKRELRILNSRKEFEQRRAMYGGRRMFRYKHLFATPRQLPKTAYPDYFVYPKLAPEIPDELVQSCIDIYQFHNENTVRCNNGVVINVEDDNSENRLNRSRIEDTSGIEDESAAEVSKAEDGANK